MENTPLALIRSGAVTVTIGTFPCGPVGPVGPVVPVAPVGPVGPIVPAGPEGPGSPFEVHAARTRMDASTALRRTTIMDSPDEERVLIAPAAGGKRDWII